MLNLDTTGDEIRALLELVQRVPMTRAEALFVEALFSRWLDQLAASAPAGAHNGAASAADVPITPGAPNAPPPQDQHIARPSQPLPAGAPLLKHIDQVQST